MREGYHCMDERLKKEALKELEDFVDAIPSYKFIGGLD